MLTQILLSFIRYQRIENNDPPFYIDTPIFLATFGRKSSKLMTPKQKYDFQKTGENNGTPKPPKAAENLDIFVSVSVDL